MLTCSHVIAQSCSLQLKFTSQADNSVLPANEVLRTNAVNGTASSRPNIRGGWAMVGMIYDDEFGFSWEFSDEMEYFHFAAPETLHEGRNKYELIGWLQRQWPHPECEASDIVRLFYVKPGDQCYAMVEELDKIPKPPNDPTNGFVTNQRCIAKYSCGNRPQMQNTTWLTKVVPAFVQPFLDKSGSWNEVMQACASQSKFLPAYVRDKRCEDKMAKYHIQQDLQKSLNENGCGTEADWDEVGTYIHECVAEQNSFIPTLVANGIIVKKRNEIRKMCQASRPKS
jgi:hypothetical protein